MASTGHIVGGIQFVVGALLTATGICAPIGIPLMISGATTIAATSMAPRPAGGKGGFSTSPTYGFDRVQNVAFEGMPSWFLIGTRRIYPTYINIYTEQKGTVQTLKMVLYCGMPWGAAGRIISLTDVRLNDQESGSFSSVSIGTYLYGGYVASTYAAMISVPAQVSVTVDGSSDGSYTYTTATSVHEVAILFAFLAGLYRLHLTGKDAGEIDWATYLVNIYYRVKGNTTWVKASCPTSGAGDWASQTGTWTLRKKSTAAVRALATIAFSTKARYEIKVVPHSTMVTSRRYPGFEPILQRFEERVKAAKYYKGAKLGISAKASGILSGNFPKVSVLASGWRKGLTETVVRNPATAISMILQEPIVGCGRWVKSTDINAASFTAAETWYDANAATSGDHKEARCKIDLVIDSSQNADEWLRHILQVYRAVLIEHGGEIYYLVDKAGSSVRTFDCRQQRSTANRPIMPLDDGRPDLKYRKIPDEDRPTHVKAEFHDVVDDYRTAWTKEYVDPDWSAGDPEIRRELYLAGVTRETEAIRACRYTLNDARLRPYVVEFAVGIGDLDLLPYDVVTVLADYPIAFASPGMKIQVLTTTQTSRHSGRILGRVYDADVYTDTTDTLPAKDAMFTRQAALLKAKAIPRGAISVRTEVA